MPRAIAINPGRGGLHTETSARRKYWRRGIVAGDRGKPGFTSQETASVASPKCQDSVTNSSFGNDGTEGGRSDCCKLWPKSANRAITSYRGRLKVDRLFVKEAADFASEPFARIRFLALQEPLAPLPSASAMRMPVRLFLTLFLAAGVAKAEIKTPENSPIEITSTGETSYADSVAIAHDNVAIHVGDTDIYADSAQYNSRTHEVLAEGHVRIYRGTDLYLAEHGIYNIDTKQIRATNIRTESEPYFVGGQNVSEISENGYLVENGMFTTDDSPTADFHLRARTIRVYEKDRVVFQNVTFYVGKVPF